MGWVEAVVAGLVMAAIALGIRILEPVDYVVTSQQQQQQQREEEDKSRCFPALFSFGSSVADTGTKATAFPPQATQNPPYGSTFFDKPASRHGDGRLNIDFWAWALKIPFLDPYLKSVGSNFRRGANFAATGATATNSTAFSPFPLATQFYQFLEFKRHVLALRTKGQGSSSPSQNTDESERLPLEDYFGKALYIIANGGNDILLWTVTQNLPFQEVELLLPEISEEILRVVEALYAEGARHILVEDVFPQGCTPYFLFNLVRLHPDQLDAVGCVEPINRLVQRHNSILKSGVLELGKRLPNASISFVDTYSRRYGIIANHDQYGFTEPTRACCGSGGEYNYRPDCLCGESKLINGMLITGGSCVNVSTHVVWDSLHYTEAFNWLTMQGILSGKHFKPSFDLVRNGCSLAEI